MTNEEFRARFQAELDRRLANFASWKEEHPLKRCRLVQYSGIECAGAIDVPDEEIEREIVGCLSEGFQVEWALNGECLVLVVYEPRDLPLDWSRIFEERDFDDF